MRTSYLVTTVAACTVGLTAAAALSRRAGRRLPAAAVVPATTAVAAPVLPAPDVDGVVLPFLRPAVPAPAPATPAAPVRCGDTGGVTKAGAPCAARATAGGRCHHHRLAA
jgi:hypothetical protein